MEFQYPTPDWKYLAVHRMDCTVASIRMEWTHPSIWNPPFPHPRDAEKKRRVIHSTQGLGTFQKTKTNSRRNGADARSECLGL